MKLRICVLCFVLCVHVSAQELFTWSEPASNMAAKAIGLRFTNTLTNRHATNGYDYLLQPEIMFGFSKKIMMHAEFFLSNKGNALTGTGEAIYFKYRLYSQDEVHRHFRVAMYARTALNNSLIRQPAIELNQGNSGYEAGLVATRLINKMAFSLGGSFVHATDNRLKNKFSYENRERNAFAYNFSSGKLLLPKEYVSYNQLNINGMIEFLGQTNFGNGKSYVDLAPTLQFIMLSKMRIDAGYRMPLIKKLDRTGTNVFLLRLEYNFFNVY